MSDYKYKFGILVKTFNGDREYVKRLVNSFNKFNVEKIKMAIVLPEEDYAYFSEFENDCIKIFFENIFYKHLINEDNILGIRPGYINQQIIKMSFWETEIFENYFCMDSEGVFIKNFHLSDFMYDSDTPYTILIEDNELRVDPEYYKNHWEKRYQYLLKIKDTVGLNANRILTNHGFSILSSKVLNSLHDNFMSPNNFIYSDLLNIAPYEFSWYNFWLQKSKPIKIEIREPLIKTFHQKSQHLLYKQMGIKESDIARGYIGYCVNSNYSRGYGVICYEDDYINDYSVRDIYKLFKKAVNLSINKVQSKIKTKKNV